MRVLVVDDEKRARESVVDVLQQFCREVTEIHQADGLKSARLLLDSIPFDAVLLDIQLKDGNGFELTQRLQELRLPVIFITAHEEYAIRAFRVSALNYLLKPIDPDELIQSIQKLANTNEQSEMESKLAVLLENSLQKSRSPRRIVLRTAENIHVVETSEIVYCEADRNYTTFYLKNRPKILVSGNIGEYEEMLPGEAFLRIHQSILVNLNEIERYEKGDGGWVFTRNGEQLPVSSRKKDVLMVYLNSLNR